MNASVAACTCSGLANPFSHLPSNGAAWDKSNQKSLLILSTVAVDISPFSLFGNNTFQLIFRVSCSTCSETDKTLHLQSSLVCAWQSQHSSTVQLQFTRSHSLMIRLDLISVKLDWVCCNIFLWRLFMTVYDWEELLVIEFWCKFLSFHTGL